ncbi:hypothetical protein SKAU_G00186520 [Synaphobranchus kaupii]|uniref:Uncharacterized protein n=1 Tax=Synaphobranchus kaupii TaxID=118154 RepID=A0A9Q1FD70_SYNKA|nr:hypothetical protein SKAU_G00186520 [Synaphobranchus kaupii]
MCARCETGHRTAMWRGLHAPSTGAAWGKWGARHTPATRELNNCGFSVAVRGNLPRRERTRVSTGLPAAGSGPPFPPDAARSNAAG